MYIPLTLDTKCTLIQALISLVRIIRVLSPRMTHLNSSFGVIFFSILSVWFYADESTQRRYSGGDGGAMAAPPASAARPLDEVARSAYKVCSVF